MIKECDYHPQLMEILGGLRADIGWLKTAFWTIPASIVFIAIAIISCFMSNERRITTLETNIASQNNVENTPYWYLKKGVAVKPSTQPYRGK